MTSWLVENLWLWALIGNLMAMTLNLLGTWRAEKLVRRTTAVRASPFYQCATHGHDLKADVMMLDSAEPPEFVLTQMVRLTCQREGCEYVQLFEIRARLYAPGVERITFRSPEIVPPEA